MYNNKPDKEINFGTKKVDYLPTRILGNLSGIAATTIKLSAFPEEEFIFQVKDSWPQPRTTYYQWHI